MSERKRNRWRKLTRRAVSTALIFVMVVTLSPLMPGRTVEIRAAGYNAQAALKYAGDHWNDGVGLCAEFVCKCLQAGGINTPTYINCMQIRNNMPGITGAQWKDLTLDANGYATKALNGNILSAGDVVLQHCYTHGSSPHVLLCAGYNSAGQAVFYAHNGTKNGNQTYKLNYNTAYEHTTSCNMKGRVLHISSSNRDPIGHVDLVESKEQGKIHVRGWTFDPDTPSQSLSLHVYVGGEAGHSGTEVHVVSANLSRPDVNKVYGITGNHGFDTTFTTGKSGSQIVAFYALNSAAGNNPNVGQKTINVLKDTIKPVIKNAKVTSKDSTGYVVECDVSDNSGVARVQFPSWTLNRVNGTDQDDIKWVNATVTNGHAKATINISDHNNETGTYRTHLYVWDVTGNSTAVALPDIVLPHITDGTVQILGEEFTAQITLSGNRALTQSGSDITASALSTESRAQQWKFTRNSDGTYFVNNLGNGENLDLYFAKDANGAVIHTHPVNTSDAQKWRIYKTSSGSYYFAPLPTKLRVMDIGGSGGKTHLWAFGDNNANQLFGIHIIDPATPAPTATAEPTATPAPTATAEPTATPAATKVPAISTEPSGTAIPEVSATRTPAPTVNPTEEPEYEEGEEDEIDLSDSVEEDQTEKRAERVGKVTSIKKKRQKKAITVTWKKVSGAGGYQVQYAGNRAFTRGRKKKKVKKTKVVFKGLGKKTYYVRVRAYKKADGKTVYGKWSKRIKISF